MLRALAEVDWLGQSTRPNDIVHNMPIYNCGNGVYTATVTRSPTTDIHHANLHSNHTKLGKGPILSEYTSTGRGRGDIARNHLHSVYTVINEEMSILLAKY